MVTPPAAAAAATTASLLTAEFLVRLDVQKLVVVHRIADCKSTADCFICRYLHY